MQVEEQVQANLEIGTTTAVVIFVFPFTPLCFLTAAVVAAHNKLCFLNDFHKDSFLQQVSAIIVCACNVVREAVVVVSLFSL